MFRGLVLQKTLICSNNYIGLEKLYREWRFEFLRPFHVHDSEGRAATVRCRLVALSELQHNTQLMLRDKNQRVDNTHSIAYIYTWILYRECRYKLLQALRFPALIATRRPAGRKEPRVGSQSRAVLSAQLVNELMLRHELSQRGHGSSLEYICTKNSYREWNLEFM